MPGMDLTNSPGNTEAPRERRPTFAIALACFLLAVSGLMAQTAPRMRARSIDQPLVENNVLAGWFHGGRSDPVLGGLALIQVKDGFWLKRFRNGDTNNLELLAEGSGCFFNPHNHNVFSDDPILIHGFSSDESRVLTTNLVVAGRGFSTQESNSVLIIWSDVYTEVIGRPDSGKSPSNSLKVGSSDALKPMVIRSEFFQFYQRSKVANYRGHVRAAQPPYTLECPGMDVHLGTNNALSSAVADGGVVITDETEQGRATGRRAVYEAETGLIHLLEQPHWQDELGRQVWAREFIFDRNSGIVTADQDAHARLPGKSMGAGGFALPGAAGAGKETNDSVFDIRAGTIQLEVARGQTNRPAVPSESLHRFAARHNMVMTNEVEGSWATSDDAVFTKETGVLRLVGNAKWSKVEGQVEGDVIEANRNTKTLTAHGRAVVRVPSRLIRGGQASPGTLPSAQTPKLGVIEIRSDDFFWQTNVASFTGRVRAVEIENGDTVGRLNCAFLELTFGGTNGTNIERMFASGGVEAQGFPADAKPSTMRANSERLEIVWYPGGTLLKRLDAEGDVRAEQAILNQPDKEIYRRARAGMLRLNFSSLTNRVETGLAQTNVFWTQMERDRHGTNVLRQSERGAKGDRADYQVEPAGRGLVLTGRALGWLATTNLETKKYSAQVLTNADNLIWSPANGKLRGNGPNWEFLPLKPGQLPR